MKWLAKIKNGLFYVGGIIAAVLGAIFFLKRSAKGSERSANDAEAIADEHENVADHAYVASEKKHDEAMNHHQDAVKKAEDVTEPNYELPEGFTPRNSSSK